jgi:hypothetical protein
MVVDVHHRRQPQLFQVVCAADLARLGAGLLQGRQEHGSQNGDDRDHNQKLDQGEADRAAGEVLHDVDSVLR